MQYHFISGLPRSGSTLLSALLRQNPHLHADVSSIVARLYLGMLISMNGEHEQASLVTPEQRMALLRGVFDGFYGAQQDKAVVVDTSRKWCAQLAALSQLFPAARVVCCVRDPAWVVDSLERMVHRNPFQLSAIFGYNAEATQSTRIEAVAALDGLMGSALDALKQAFYGDHHAHILLLRYETLVSDPEHALRSVYAFWDQPFFEHDFAGVSFQSDVLDQRLNTPGLHHVRRGVSFAERQTILPPDVFAQLQALNFWDDPARNARGVKVV